MALDLCVQPDVVNRHKQVRHASFFSCLCSPWKLCPHIGVLNLPQTALMLAAMHGRTECVRRLLDAGANVRLTDTRFRLLGPLLDWS
jgi:E3 ubiquitin-protein ligase XBAT32/33